MEQSNSKTTPPEIPVHVPEILRAGKYANMANINVTPAEVVLNFVYFHPADTPQGTLVSRIVLSRNHAKEFAKKLKEVVEIADEVNPND